VEPRVESDITSFLAMLPVAGYVKDRKGRLLYVNAAAEKLWKVKAGDVLGKTLCEVLGLSERQVRANDLKVFQQNAAYLSVHPAVPGSSPLRSMMEFPIVSAEGRRVIGGLTVQWNG
jgi:PAS domain-containing protein